MSDIVAILNSFAEIKTRLYSSIEKICNLLPPNDLRMKVGKQYDSCTRDYIKRKLFKMFDDFLENRPIVSKPMSRDFSRNFYIGYTHPKSGIFYTVSPKYYIENALYYYFLAPYFVIHYLDSQNLSGEVKDSWDTLKKFIEVAKARKENEMFEYFQIQLDLYYDTALGYPYCGCIDYLDYYWHGIRNALICLHSEAFQDLCPDLLSKLDTLTETKYEELKALLSQTQPNTADFEERYCKLCEMRFDMLQLLPKEKQQEELRTAIIELVRYIETKSKPENIKSETRTQDEIADAMKRIRDSFDALDSQKRSEIICDETNEAIVKVQELLIERLSYGTRNGIHLVMFIVLYSLCLPEIIITIVYGALHKSLVAILVACATVITAFSAIVFTCICAARGASSWLTYSFDCMRDKLTAQDKSIEEKHTEEHTYDLSEDSMNSLDMTR
jgi:hypothetical protein